MLLSLLISYSNSPETKNHPLEFSCAPNPRGRLWLGAFYSFFQSKPANAFHLFRLSMAGKISSSDDR